MKRRLLNKFAGITLLFSGTLLSSGLLAQQVIDALAATDPSNLPIIGDPADRMLSPAQERAIGINAMRNLYRNAQIMDDPEAAYYIQHLGNRLTNSLDSNEQTYTFFIVNDPAINAFAMPGGYVGVNAGLILASRNENELAGVLAHEIAHVSQRHIARRLADIQSNSAPTVGAILAGILLTAGGNARAGQALLYAGIAASVQQQLNFTRAHEIEADRIGLGVLYRAGFDPNGMADFFRTLRRQRLSPNADQFEFLRTHPVDNTRITEARLRISRLPGQINPDTLQYHMVKARLQALVSDDTQTLVYNMEKQAANDPAGKSIINRYAYSQALERNGDAEKAVHILHSVVSTDEENANFQIALARANLKNGENKQSIATLERMIRIYPDHYPTTLYYAEALSTAGRPQEGRELLKNYLREHDTTPTIEIYKLLAELHAKSGDHVDSKQMLAEYYFRTGNFSGAIEQLRHALNDKNIDYITRSQIERMLKIIMIASRRARS